MFTEKLKQTYPLGIHIMTGDMEASTLRTLIDYPAERTVSGVFLKQKRLDAIDPSCLQAEIHIEPHNFSLLKPSSEFILSPLDNEENSEIQDNEEALVERFLQKYPDFIGGFMDADLRNTHKLMECLYVENIPMSKVTDILLHHPDIKTDELKETLQLFDLMNRGVEVLESHKTLMPRVAEHVTRVTADLQHMYTGEDKPLTSHSYYHKDIRPRYDRELKEMAELKLRERKMIQTRPQSFTVTWSNSKGDGWECREMVDIINDRFQDYRGMLARAEQSQAGPDRPVMQLDIITTKPRWRKEVMDTVQRSWAFRGMTEITDRSELQLDISTWHEQNDAQKLLHFHFAGVKDSLYMFETGTDGFVIIDRDRSVKRFGEEFSPKNKAILERLVSRENMMTADGSLFMRPAGPERVYLEKESGRKINVFQETVNGQQMLVNPYKLTQSWVQHAPENYVEITGRLTDARVIGDGYSSAIRCRIDGEQHPATRLSYPDAHGYKNGIVTAEQLAVKYFAYELMNTQSLDQQQNKGMKR